MTFVFLSLDYLIQDDYLIISSSIHLLGNFIISFFKELNNRKEGVRDGKAGQRRE